MISKNKAKFITSLSKKKTRDEEGLYIIEGDKIIREFLGAGITVVILAAKHEFIGSLGPGLRQHVLEVVEVTYEELKQLSSLKTPHNALAVVKIPDREFDAVSVLDDLCVALDFVQDPGNLGTIIRAAGWFGILNIVCSTDCVDVYNTKVVQASMGAMLHVNVYYHDLRDFLSIARQKGIPVYGAAPKGISIYDHKLDKKAVILLGNESKGISDKYLSLISEQLMIPRFSNAPEGIDSLNVGMAASVIFSEFRRREL